MSTFPPPQGYQTNPVILHEVAFAGAATLDTGELLTKDVLARTELFYEDDTGVQVQLTSGGKINSAAMSLGTANQVIGTNNAATAIEWKSFAVGAGISITHGAGTITVTNTMPGVTAHGGLTGLVAPADDHTQYALLAGRAGGQIQIGGTGAADPYTITATSNATAGAIIFNGKPALEFARFLPTGELTIGSATIAGGGESLYIYKNSNAVVSARIQNGTSGTVSKAALVFYDSQLFDVGTCSAGFTTAEGRTAGNAYLWAANGINYIADSGTVGHSFICNDATNAYKQAMLLTGDANASSLLVKHAYAGAAAYARYQVLNNSGICGTVISTSTTWSSGLGLNANEFGILAETGLASLAIATQGAVPIRFVTNATQVGAWLSGGTLCINATAAISTEKLYVNGSINLAATGNLMWADASKNIRVGQGVLAAMTTGTVLIAIGYNAMSTGIVTGNNDIAIGQNALDILTDADGCIGIGTSAGDSILTGDDQICIGRFSDAGAATTKTAAIGYNATVSASNTIALGGSGANACAVVIAASAAIGTELLYVASGGIRGVGTTWLGCPAAAPADATLTANQVTIWVDEVNNNAVIKVKYSGGTVKSGTVALS